MVKNVLNARLLALILSIFIGLLLTACGGGEAPVVTDPTVDTAAVENGGDSAPGVDATLVPAGENAEEVEDSGEEAAATLDPNASPSPTSLFATFDSPEEQAMLLTPITFPTAEPTAEGELPIPGPGTLVASETEDPNADQSFTLVRFSRTGGPEINGEQQEVLIEIEGDGTIRRNGVEGQISQDAIDQINLMIREMNFFGAQGTFMGPLGAEDSTTFVYRVTVERGLEERSINAMDGFMPVELQQLIGEITLLGDQLR